MEMLNGISIFERLSPNTHAVSFSSHGSRLPIQNGALHTTRFARFHGLEALRERHLQDVGPAHLQTGARHLGRNGVGAVEPLARNADRDLLRSARYGPCSKNEGGAEDPEENQPSVASARRNPQRAAKHRHHEERRDELLVGWRKTSGTDLSRRHHLAKLGGRPPAGQIFHRKYSSACATGDSLRGIPIPWLPVRRLMGPLEGIFRRVMGPPLRSMKGPPAREA